MQHLPRHPSERYVNEYVNGIPRLTRNLELYDKLDEPSDEEYDMLDLAFGLTETCVLSSFLKNSNLIFQSQIQIRVSNQIIRCF